MRDIAPCECDTGSPHRQLSPAGAGDDVELLEPVLAVFTHVEGHRQFWGPLSRKGGADPITRLLRESVDDLVRRHLQSRFGGSVIDPTQLEAAVQFVAGACMGLLVWWLDHEDIPSSAEAIHAIFRRLATPGLERFLTPGSQRDGRPSGYAS